MRLPSPPLLVLRSTSAIVRAAPSEARRERVGANPNYRELKDPEDDLEKNASATAADRYGEFLNQWVELSVV